MAANAFETVEGWELCADGPGIFASCEDGFHSVWIEDGCLHHESSGDWEVDIPLPVVFRLIALRFDDRNCRCGLSRHRPGAVMGHANHCELGKAGRANGR